MIEKKTWDELRDSGLIVFINQILHIFGWAIVFEIDENQKVKNCYPAKTKFRGFDEKTTEEAYQKLSKYMLENSDKLHKEVNE